MELLVVFCTFPDVEKAREIGTALVESQLAACVNLLPSVESIYRWQGAIEQGNEVLAIFKTTSLAFEAFSSRLRSLHPYEVPEIVAIQPQEVSSGYAKWVGEEVAVG